MGNDPRLEQPVVQHRSTDGEHRLSKRIRQINRRLQYDGARLEMGSIRCSCCDELLAQGKERQRGEDGKDEGGALGDSGAYVPNSQSFLDCCVRRSLQDRIDHEGNTGDGNSHDQIQQSHHDQLALVRGCVGEHAGTIDQGQNQGSELGD